MLERKAPHLIAVLNGSSLSRFLEKFQKLFADSLNTEMNSHLRATAYFGNFVIAEIVQCMEQKSLPLGSGAAGQYRKDFLAGFHAANILLRRFGVGKTPLSDNDVLVIAAFVPMVMLFTVKAPIKTLRQFPKFVEIGSVLLGHVAPVFFDNNFHFAFSFRTVLAGTVRKEAGIDTVI